MLPYIHIIALSTALILSTLYGMKLSVWMRWVIIGIGSVYVLLVTTFVFDLGLNPLYNTQISEFFLKSLSLYCLAALVGFLIPSPKTHFQVVLKILLSKKFFKPTGILIGIVLIPFILESTSSVVYRFIPEIDKYEDIDIGWLGYLAKKNKGLAIPDIMDSSMNNYDKIIRMYVLPSFEKEIMIELKFRRGALSVTALTPQEKPISEDRYYQYSDKHGEATDGGFHGLRKYKPSVTITRFNLNRIEAIQEIVDSLNELPLHEMKSISRAPKFGNAIISCFDGTEFIIDVKNQGKRNTFAFWEQKYDDYRYNWLSEQFPTFFKLILKYSTPDSITP